MIARTQRKNYFQYELPNEVMIYVFTYVKNPINLTVSCKRWSLICKDSQAKAEWIIYQFGRAQCLFHAVRLGPKFISVDVARAIISKGGILSRYFAQRLLIHYGNYDQKLIELKIVHSVGQADIDRIKNLQQKMIPWARWAKPDVKTVKARLTELIDLGFQLSDSIILDIFHLFESRLDEVGKILIDSFTGIKQETQDVFLRRCLAVSQNPAKNFTNITSFFDKYLSNTAGKASDDAFNFYSSNLKHQNLESIEFQTQTPY
ncbi:20073_t:CDS:2 [Cetraspora pellucida]|uniref:20073_t:CDS:1 n=1 Tax=Cetraspora pellucida TaxID=1433469 RepID=A0A9N9ICW6_9GLOM|nr:20073_t:CDS:2 [Cetraspora pellucida]